MLQPAHVLNSHRIKFFDCSGIKSNPNLPRCLKGSQVDLKSTQEGNVFIKSFAMFEMSPRSENSQ